MSTPSETVGAAVDFDHGVIAWQGTVEILNATWSLDSGRTVELRLCGDSYDRVHPFKRFQKRRNGRVGTRFQAAFSRVDSGQEVLSMEVMLAAWKDSSSIGQSITLWLDDEVTVHPFCGCIRRKAGQPGDVFALVLVELNDDDSAVRQAQWNQAHPNLPRNTQEGATRVAGGVHDPAAVTQGDIAPQDQGEKSNAGASTRAKRATNGKPANARPRRLSSSVHLLVTSPIFLRWLQETKGTLVKEWNPELARRYAKKVIGVESMIDLDRDQEAVQRYHNEIRRPFERWRYQEP